MVEEMKAATIGSGAEALLRLFKEIWEHEVIPTVIISIHKKEGKLNCSNYRDISFLCHSSKIFSSIILQRINGIKEEILA